MYDSYSELWSSHPHLMLYIQSYAQTVGLNITSALIWNAVIIVAKVTIFAVCDLLS